MIASNSLDNELAKTLPSGVLREICCRLDAAMDRLCMTLACKSWYDRRLQYLTFNVDHLLYARNPVGDHYSISELTNIDSASLISTSTLQSLLSRGHNIRGTFKSRMIHSLQSTPGVVVLNAYHINEGLALPSDANITKLVITVPYTKDHVPVPITLPSHPPASLTHLEINVPWSIETTVVIPDTLVSMPITHLTLSQITIAGKLNIPPTVTHLDIDEYCNVVLVSIPSSVTYLRFPPPQGMAPGFIPPSVTSLHFVSIPDNSPPLQVAHLPSSLRTLDLGLNIDQDIVPGAIPASVESLSFRVPNPSLIASIIPSSVTYLNLGLDFQNEHAMYDFAFIPGSVTELALSGDLQLQSLDSFPPSVATLELRFGSYSDHLVIPSSVTHLKYHAHPDLFPAVPPRYPPSLKAITLKWEEYAYVDQLYISNISIQHDDRVGDGDCWILLQESSNIERTTRDERFNSQITTFGRVIDDNWMLVVSSDLLRCSFVPLSKLRFPGDVRLCWHGQKFLRFFKNDISHSIFTST